MRVDIIAGDDVLRRFGNQIGSLGEGDAHKALARAVNRVTNTVHGRVIRAVAKQSSIPTAIVRRTIKKRLASPKAFHGGSIEGVVYATGSPLPLKVFQPKQFAFGVRVRVFGKMQRYPGWFIHAGRWSSGKFVANGHVFARLTKDSLPIEMKFGPSIPEELVRGESEQVYRRTVDEMLIKRVAHELNRLLP